MATTLPPELLTHILRLAQEGEPPAEQLEMRLTFERVCRAWFNADFRYRVVAVSSLASFKQFLGTLDGLQRAADADHAARGEEGVAERVSLGVHSLHLTLTELGREDDAGVVIPAIERMQNLESLEFSLACWVPPGGFPVRPPEVTLDSTASLPRLKHFAFGGAHGPKSWLMGLDRLLLRQLPLMPALESFAVSNLRNCTWVARWITLIAAHSPRFHSVRLGEIAESVSSHFPLLCELPPGTTHFSDDSSYFSEQPWRASSLNKDPHVLSLAHRLRVLQLTDGAGKVWSEGERGLCDRGVYDTFVDALVNVEALAISPVAIIDLGLLVKLPRLTDLRLVVGRFTPRQAVQPLELVSLLRGSTSLRSVTLDRSISQGWSKQQTSDVMNAGGDRVVIDLG